MQHQCHHTRNHTTPLQGQLSRKIKINSFGISFAQLKRYRLGVEIPWQELLFPFCVFLRKAVKKLSGDKLWCAGAAGSPRPRSCSLGTTQPVLN